MNYPKKVTVGHITVRDGYQHEEKFIPTESKLWKLFIATSVKHSEEVYKRLNVTLTQADIMAESAYNAELN